MYRPPFGQFAPVPWCGCWFRRPNFEEKRYLPQVQVDIHTTILASTSRSVLRQTFHNPLDKPIYEAIYTFPLYDGISVAGFTYSVGGRTVVGVVKERNQARDDYEKAKAKGQTAGLLEQNVDAADVFTTSIGNIPAGENVLVEITYLGELKNDAETDGVRFTIPTSIAPRYGTQTVKPLSELPNVGSKEMKITVDIVLDEGSAIRGIQSPSHPIAISMGRTSAHGDDNDSIFQNNMASATLGLGTTELDTDFLLVVSAKDHDTPRALLETHPKIPNQRALLATLVPKFNISNNIPPEIVFVVDRSGSMGGKMHLVIDALKIFLKSLPIGVKFNICSFGSMHDFLFERSKTYDATSLKQAMDYINPVSFQADFGGTEMTTPVEDVIKRRYSDLSLEVMLMTDGEIWNQDALFKIVNEASKQNTRFFTLGIGSSASSALVEGVARAGRGFSQFVLDGERIDKRIVRMLKGALSPHIQYQVEIRYAQEKSDDEDFEIIDSFEKNTKSVVVGETNKSNSAQKTALIKKKISLFSSKARDEPTNPPAGRYDHLPSISKPSVLQTPHTLPELYPHSRTSVYLLLAPETSGRTPEAVILRGTSKDEELELEIPIQNVGKGETIHKLATKKATQELEEGRGWLTALRTANGKTLQSQHEGNWDLIVEREAVRLCTTFQVAGRYCSFVAVEEFKTDASTQETSEVVLLAPPPPPPPYHQLNQQSQQHRPSGGFSFGRPALPAVSYPAQPSYARKSSRGGFGGGLFGNNNATTGGLFGNSNAKPDGALFGMSSALTSNSPGASRSMAAPSAFGSAAPPPPPAPSKDSRSSLRARKKSSNKESKSYAPHSAFSSFGAPRDRHDTALRRAESGGGEYEDEATAGLESESESEGIGLSTTSALDKMQQLVSLQNFIGSWSSSVEFLTIISLCATDSFSKSDVKEIVVKILAASGKSHMDWAEDLSEDDYATVLAIGWLEVAMKDESDVWEMVVEKARGYLEGRVDGSDQVNELIDAVRDLWKASP